MSETYYKQVSASIKPFMYFVVDSKTDNNTNQSIFLELHMLIHFGNVYHVRHADAT